MFRQMFCDDEFASFKVTFRSLRFKGFVVIGRLAVARPVAPVDLVT